VSAELYASRLGENVLRVLAKAGGPLTIRKVANAVAAHRDHVAEVLRSARRGGYVNTYRRDGSIQWVITEAGRVYLAGLRRGHSDSLAPPGYGCTP
jgi:DNA-binding IclR family transcriptional regulator